MVVIVKHLMRLWFLFRTGFSTYLNFLLGVASTLTVIYYLLINNIPDLKAFFPSFLMFALPAVLVIIPAAVFVGWLHFKGMPAYSSEIDIAIESNPFVFKWSPGWQKQVEGPLALLLLDLLEKIAGGKELTDQDREKIATIRKKLAVLNEGQMLPGLRTRSNS